MDRAQVLVRFKGFGDTVMLFGWLMKVKNVVLGR